MDYIEKAWINEDVSISGYPLLDGLDPNEPVNLFSISGGKDSTALALLGVEQRPPNMRFVFADTGHEHVTTYEYVKKLDRILRERIGIGVTWVKADFSRRIAIKRETVKNKWPDDLAQGAPGEWAKSGPHKRLERRAETKEHETIEGLRAKYQFTPEPPAREPANPYESLEQAGWRWRPAVAPMSESEIESRVKLALGALKPTGIPFLDLCLLRGRFPSTRARFCTQELKQRPIEAVTMELVAACKKVISWQGVRADESPSRAKLAEFEDMGGFGIHAYRPILHWSAEKVFDKHREHNVPWNPLYEQGMSRVGCMPCIHARKGELREISMRYPDETKRVQQWELLVSEAAKRGFSAFFAADKTPGVGDRRSTIDKVMQWSKTNRGGRQQDLLGPNGEDEVPRCSSVYGLCE